MTSSSKGKMSSMTAMQPCYSKNLCVLAVCWLPLILSLTDQNYNCICGGLRLTTSKNVEPWKLKVYFLFKSSFLLLHKAADIGLLHMMIYCFDPWHADRSLKSPSSLKTACCKSYSIMPTCPAGSSTFADLSRQKTKPGIPFFRAWVSWHSGKGG